LTISRTEATAKNKNLNGKSKTDFDEQQTIQEQFANAIEAGKESARNEKYNNSSYDFDENIPFD
jgi:hypothetical protein